MCLLLEPSAETSTLEPETIIKLQKDGQKSPSPSYPMLFSSFSWAAWPILAPFACSLNLWLRHPHWNQKQSSSCRNLASHGEIGKEKVTFVLRKYAIAPTAFHQRYLSVFVRSDPFNVLRCWILAAGIFWCIPQHCTLDRSAVNDFSLSAKNRRTFPNYETATFTASQFKLAKKLNIETLKNLNIAKILFDSAFTKYAYRMKFDALFNGSYHFILLFTYYAFDFVQIYATSAHSIGLLINICPEKSFFPLHMWE